LKQEREEKSHFQAIQQNIFYLPAPFLPEGRLSRTLLKRADAETHMTFTRRAIFALRGKNRREIF